MNYLLNWLEKNKEKKIRPSASPTFYRNFLENSGEVRSDKHYTSTVTSLCRDLTTRGKRDVSRRVDLPQTLRRIRDGRECVLPANRGLVDDFPNRLRGLRTRYRVVPRDPPRCEWTEWWWEKEGRVARRESGRKGHQIP